jgi:hypothetical protein
MFNHTTDLKVKAIPKRRLSQSPIMNRLGSICLGEGISEVIQEKRLCIEGTEVVGVSR